MHYPQDNMICHKSIMPTKLHFLFFIFLIVIHLCKAEQPLRGMELQEKEAQKDYSI